LFFFSYWFCLLDNEEKEGEVGRYNGLCVSVKRFYKGQKLEKAKPHQKIGSFVSHKFFWPMRFIQSPLGFTHVII